MLVLPLPKHKSQMDQIQKAILSHSYLPIEPNEVVSVLVMKTTPSQREDEVRHFAVLENSFAETPTHERNLISHLVAFNDFKIKMTQYDELTVYKIVAPRQKEGSEVLPPLYFLPKNWVEEIPGVLVTVAFIDITRCEGKPSELAESAYCGLLPAGRQFGGYFGKSGLLMVTSLTKDEQGVVPFHVIVNDKVTANELGRFIHRLTLMTAFYMAALTFLLEKDEMMEKVDRFDGELRKVSWELENTLRQPTDEVIYKRLTELAVQIENLDAGSHRILHSTHEYISLVRNLLVLMKEERLPKMESFQNFILSTLEPIERSNQLLTNLISTLNKKVFQQNELVRSRIDIRLEQQNQQIFHELKVQANKQIQLQETVEGFSVAAISYYSVSLLGYGLKSLPESLLMGLSVEVIKGIAVPFVVVATYWSMQKIKKKFGLGE